MDHAGIVYDTLLTAGADLGISNAGHYAINSLRLEKGYRAWEPSSRQMTLRSRRAWLCYRLEQILFGTSCASKAEEAGLSVV
jgi:4-methylaminobutanoate oxidase (formaldehyde-forming)